MAAPTATDVWSEQYPGQPQPPFKTQPAAPPVQYGDPPPAAGNQTATQANAPANSGPWGGGDYKSWIGSKLQAVNSTDSPDYWYGQAAKDPKFMAGDPSAQAWWEDAINRGDGSSLVTSGQLQKRGAGSGAPGASGGSPTPGAPDLGSGFVPQPFVPKPYQASGVVGDPAQTGGFQNQLLEALRGRAGQSLNVNADDPIIHGQVAAYNATQQRAARQGLAAEAERAGANTNMRAERRSADEQIGQNTAGFQAQLMAGERDARRQEIQAALNGQQGILTSQQQMQLQQELASLEREQQQYQFGAGNAQQESQFMRSLLENESQFGRNLGQNAYQFDINDQYRNSPLA